MTKKHLSRLLALLLLALTTMSEVRAQHSPESSPQSSRQFVSVRGTSLVEPSGKPLFIRGTNLGNWLNPEGYMFGFTRANAPWMIEQTLDELVGPDEAADFWRAFKDRYVTVDDIRFIASQGANTIRLPFNYKLFTDDDYMGLTARQDGFERVDSVVKWCRDNGLYLILDMHDCPGGQTGDNIDDGYGYPWLFVSPRAQQLFVSIWQRIAQRYHDEPVILGYELMNEPIATYFSDEEQRLNALVEPLYKRTVKAIREVDTNHVVLLGGTQWNSNFSAFTDWTFDSNIMYTCHRYGGGTDKGAFQSYIDFRDKTGLPMYMGETGHGTDEWQAQVVRTLTDNNIGYTFWPYKKVDGSCMVAVHRPALWDSVVVKFAEADRSTFAAIRKARPDQAVARRVLRDYLDSIRFQACVPQQSYIQSMNLRGDNGGKQKKARRAKRK